MATATVSIVLRKRPNKDGTRPLIIQITKNRKTSTVHTGQSIMESDWDEEARKVKKSHPNSVRLNNYLRKELSKVDDKLLELESVDTTVTAVKVKENIKPPAEKLFFSQAILYLEDLKKAHKYNQYTADKPRIKHFKDFLNNPKEIPESEAEKENKKVSYEERYEQFKKFLKDKDIPFTNITAGLLERFVIYLTALGDKNQRTIMNHLVAIRSVFSYAAKSKVIDKKISPFGKEGIKIKFPDSLKIGLTPEEVKRVEEVELPEGSIQEHARKLWLFSYYFAGMRVSDVLRLQWSDMQNGRLYYAMGKNDKGGSLKIPTKAMQIILAYEKEKRSDDDSVFPDLKAVPDLNNKFIIDRTIAFTASRIDKFLRNYVAPAANIKKPLTMHIARHTFGNISGDRIPIQMLQKLYRHSHITTTIGYLRCVGFDGQWSCLGFVKNLVLFKVHRT